MKPVFQVGPPTHGTDRGRLARGCFARALTPRTLIVRGRFEARRNLWRSAEDDDLDPRRVKVSKFAFTPPQLLQPVARKNGLLRPIEAGRRRSESMFFLLLLSKKKLDRVSRADGGPSWS